MTESPHHATHSSFSVSIWQRYLVAGQPAPESSPESGFFPGLVAIARGKHPIPSRTRPLSPVAPMVLRLKTWESRSPPDQITREAALKSHRKPQSSLSSQTSPPNAGRHLPWHLDQGQKRNQRHVPKDNPIGAGWSSPVARQAHNLKVAGSNPAPATKSQTISDTYGWLDALRQAK